MPGIVEYPPEIVEAARNISTSSTQLNTLMSDLTKHKSALQAVSGGAIATAFDEAHQAWNRSGLSNSERFQAVGRIANQSHSDMIQFDQATARKFV